MKDIDKIIKDGLKEIDKEVKQEGDIREEAKYITKQLLENPKITIIYENEFADNEEDKYEEYELGVRYNSAKITLVALSKTKQRLVNEYNKTAFKPKIYTPMTLIADKDDFTYEQVINTLVSAFLAKLRGEFKIEVLEE